MAPRNELTENGAGETLLGADDPRPVVIFNAEGASPFLLTGDHAGNRIPARLGTLGLSAGERVRHIAWDIGVMELGTALADRLDATFLAQRYSRLVIDCNRDPVSGDAVPEISDGTVIPGNKAPDARSIRQRIDEIHQPYQSAIGHMIDARAQKGQRTILIALHSFTPAMGGIARPWDVGVLHWKGDTRFARALLASLTEEAGLTVGDNQPYRMDATDYSVPRHAFPAGLPPAEIPYAEIEVRQDLIGDQAGQARWCDILARSLSRAALILSIGT
jgi:predicted N-formylglutamate amidohydrolase